MAEISQIKLPNGSTYDIKDATHKLELPVNFYNNDNEYCGTLAHSDANVTVLTLNNPNYSIANGDSANNTSWKVLNGYYVNDADNVWTSRFASHMQAWGMDNAICAGMSVKNPYYNNTSTNIFDVGIASDGTNFYGVTSPFAFRRDITDSSLMKTSSRLYTSSNLSVANSTNVEMANLTLTPGMWLVIGSAFFSSNATGRRSIKISETSGTDSSTPISTVVQTAISGAVTRMITVQPVYIEKTRDSNDIVTSFTNTKTIYLVGWQNSGSTLTSCGAQLTAILL